MFAKRPLPTPNAPPRPGAELYDCCRPIPSYMGSMARKRFIALIIAGIFVALHLTAGQLLGRDRPDLAALVSWDEGTILTFAKTYHDGKVGPVFIGESRATLKGRLKAASLLEQDKLNLDNDESEWKFAIPAQSGGYSIYTVKFNRDQVASVRSFYSCLAGL